MASIQSFAKIAVITSSLMYEAPTNLGEIMPRLIPRHVMLDFNRRLREMAQAINSKAELAEWSKDLATLKAVKDGENRGKVIAGYPVKRGVPWQDQIENILSAMEAKYL